MSLCVKVKSNIFLLLTGVQTPNCIRATAFDALALDYPKVMVLADATAAASPKVHDGTALDACWNF